MPRTSTLRIVLILLCLVICQDGFAQERTQTDSKEWARWRGPNGNGIVDASNDVPLTWSESENVVWKVKVPGRGHSSPMIVDGKIFLTTADKKAETQSVVCFDQDTGKRLWSKVVNEGGFPPKIHGKNTHASSTVAVADNRVFAVFYHHDSVHGTCLDFDGNQIWQKKIGDYDPDFPFGYGSSPITVGDKFIVSSESKKDSAITAFDVETGEIRWSVERKLPKGYKLSLIHI